MPNPSGADPSPSPAVRHRSRTSEAREHTALLLEVARRYHQEGQSQAQIAEGIAFSRPTVSRLLAEARATGIVQISVKHPLERVLRLERALVRTFGLTLARVAEPAHSTGQLDVARCAADLIVEHSDEDVVLTVSSGRAVTATVAAMPQLAWPRSRVVQMIGSEGQTERLQDSPETCRWMARKLGGSFHPLPAPLVVQDANTASVLMADNQIATTLELGARADVALVGVGAVTDGHSGSIFRDFEDVATAEDLRRMGAVAHICGHHISATGEHMRVGPCRRTISMEPERLKNIPLVVAVAVGEEKVAPLAAVMRGGFITALATDVTTAVRMLEFADAVTRR